MAKVTTIVQAHHTTVNGDYCGIVKFIGSTGLVQIFAYVVDMSMPDGCVTLYDPEKCMQRVDSFSAGVSESHYKTKAGMQKILHHQFTHDPHN